MGHLKGFVIRVGTLQPAGELWEVAVPELDTSVFLIAGSKVKNGDERLVVLNRVAQNVVERVRGQHPDVVFVYRKHSIETMNNTAWQQARKRAGLPQVRVHDLKHTFGRRLRAAGVTFEDRQDLLGHRSGRITTHYSAAELANLIEAANRVCESGSRKTPALVILKNKRSPRERQAHDLRLKFGAPGRIRTHDPLVRSQVLYPTELRARKAMILPRNPRD